MSKSANLRRNKRNLRGFPEATVRITLYAFKWILLLILIYVVISVIMMVYIQRYEFLAEIVGISIGGFFAFFMGYFGWMFAHSIMEWLGRKKEPKESKRAKPLQLSSESHNDSYEVDYETLARKGSFGKR